MEGLSGYSGRTAMPSVSQGWASSSHTLALKTESLLVLASSLLSAVLQHTEQIYLKHVDDKEGNYTMVHDERNITAILDWQMARVVSDREAFGPSLGEG